MLVAENPEKRSHAGGRRQARRSSFHRGAILTGKESTQLGVVPGMGPRSKLTKVPRHLTDVVAISAGGRHSLALR
jgi:hypothetical protein